MVRFDQLLFCMIITLSVTTFILHWHAPDDKRKHVHLRTSVKKCELDATCDTLETCHHNMCVHFWPMSAAKTCACHSSCEQDVRLYEEHFNLKNITDVKPFEGISNDTCVISYRVVGTASGLSVSEYERRKRGSVCRTERLDDVNVALCLKIEQQHSTKVKEKRPIEQQNSTKVKLKEKRPIEQQKHKMVVVTGAKHDLPRDKKSQTVVREMPSKTEVPLPSLRHVDPFIGTATTGHTTPGAKAPFGMMYMVPVNSYDPMGSKWWEYTAGYQYSDKTFSGIAHTALTGTGIPGLLDVKISPFKKSRDKSNEIAHPGYYSVTVDGVNIAVIAGNRFGIHRYTGTSHLFLKSKGCVSTNAKNTITGSCSAYFNEKWEKQKYPYSVHFYIELPSGCTYEQQTMTCPGKNIELKIAISYVDQNGAKANFKDENTDWKSLHKKTSTEWARLMDKIQVHGWHSEKQRKIFSSALYRTLLSPYTHNDADGRIRGPDGAIHTVDFTYYTFLSTWDTYRAWSSVIRLVRPDVLTDIAKTSVFHYKTMGIMPRWTVAGLDIQMMPGVPSMNVAFQAWRWGLTDSQLTKDIYEAMVGTLESKTKYKEGHLDAFVEKGVVPCGDKFQETVSQSLELGLNARCAAELAAHLHDSKESKWRHLSRAYRRHYDPDTKYLVGVNGANFCKPSSAYKVDANPELYTEGNAITWLWSAPFEGVKSLLGPELFKQRLHDLFTKSVGAVSKRDYSGLIGAYAHGNEPTHHVPFWFKQNGDEATTNKYVHQILDTLYFDTPDGLPGNDDAGQISAWYVLATMGIYPVDPLAKEFQTHEPRVQYAVLNEPSGLRHTLTPTSKKEHHVVKYTIPDSLKPYVTNHPEGGLFVKTGDIPEMWIRDSVAQVWPYRDSHPGMIAEVLYRQSEFILHDVYANSYNLKWQVSDKLNRHMQTLGRGEWVGTRNYELDSGCYFLRLLYHAWKKHQLEIKTFRPSVELLVETWQVEQYHEEQSPYRYPELKRNGLGTPVKWTGMTWTGFRPSDDPCTYGYHVPDNLFAAKALEYVSEMFPDIKEARTLRQQILTGVQEHGTWTDNDGKKRYCYEVDGLGGCNKMDDANVPSLLSIPYLDPEGYNHVIWQNTYEWIWSSKNPYFYKGTAAEGIGSPHTPAQYIWPMSLVMRGLVDPTVAEEMRKQIEKTKVRGKLHESFHKDEPKRLTREDFSWPNELYKELRGSPISETFITTEQSFCKPEYRPGYKSTPWYSMYVKRVKSIKPFAPCDNCIDEQTSATWKAKVCSRWWESNTQRVWEDRKDRIVSSKTYNGTVANCPFGQDIKPRHRCSEHFEKLFGLLNKHGIVYFPTDGTALGIARDSAYITADGDIDIYLEYPASLLKELLKKIGMHVSIQTYGSGHAHNTNYANIYSGTCMSTTLQMNQRYVHAIASQASDMCRCYMNGIELRCHKKSVERMYWQYGPSWRMSIAGAKKLDEPRYCYRSNPNQEYGWCPRAKQAMDALRDTNGLITENSIQQLLPKDANTAQINEILAHLNLYADGSYF